MQYAPSSDIEQILLDESTRSDLTVDDVITMAMRFDDAMIAIYRETASEIADVHAREVFQNLAEMEHREKQRFVRDAEWVQDL
jgi:rubrerythrin